ncbi:MAG: hypothetical protein R2911_27935 [Caldilineaceae bacterium]
MAASPFYGWYSVLGCALEANAIVLDARIGDGDEPDFLVAGADVRDVEAEHFQAFFELFHQKSFLFNMVGFLSIL